MTIAYMERVDSEDRTQLLQWGISLALVLVLHVAVAYFVLIREVPVEQNKPPPAAYLDLPPLSNGPLPPATAPAPPKVIPPAPKIQAAPEPTPKPPAPPKAEAPPPQPPPKSVAPAIIPPQAAPAVVPKIAPPRPPAPKPAPQQHTQPKAAPTPAPPAQGSNTPLYVDPIREWQEGVITRLQKYQIMPPDIRVGQIVPPVLLHFRIDRQGRILSCYLNAPSGVPSLDRAALEMVRRAQSLPPLPPNIPGEVYEFNMEFRFL